MSVRFPFPIDERHVVDLLLKKERRAVLLFAVKAPRSESANAVLELVQEAARRCRATPEQLREIVATLEAETQGEAAELVSELLMHPDMPTDVLTRYARRGEHLAALGHRGGPRELLEVLADVHAYPEAIATLAMKYVGRPDESVEAFRAFLERHRGVEMLGYALHRATHLDEERRAIVRALFGEPMSRRKRRAREEES